MHRTPPPAMKKPAPNPSTLPIPSKWSRYYRKLQSLRASLVAERAEQVAEVAVPLELHSVDDGDRATDEFDHELALGILANEENALFEVEAAIQRILDGTYGICEVTGKVIPEARLRVVPWTRYTKEALDRIEQKQAETPSIKS